MLAARNPDKGGEAERLIRARFPNAQVRFDALDPCLPRGTTNPIPRTRSFKTGKPGSCTTYFYASQG